MRTSPAKRIVACLILLALLAFAAPTFALSTWLSLGQATITPTTVKVGETVNIHIKTMSEGSVAALGELVMESPSGKRTVTIPMTAAPGGLAGTLKIPEGMEAGIWKFRQLSMTNAHLETRVVRSGYVTGVNRPAREYITFSPQFTVESTATDAAAPKLKSLAWGSVTAVAGQPVTFVADVSDDAGDTAVVRATVVQQRLPIEPFWEHELTLFKAEDGAWKGSFFAPVDNFPEGTLRITQVSLRDKAGNLTELKESDLKDVGPGVLAITEPTIPAGLATEPFIVNVVHKGAYTFTDWNREDLRMIADLYEQLDVDLDALRAKVNWQILTLLDAAKALRTEIFTDPKTTYRFVPLNTSGKWWALDKAFQARLVILNEASRRDGELLPNFSISKDEALQMFNVNFDWDGNLTAVDPAAYADSGPRLMAGVLDTLGRSTLPTNLMSLPHRAPTGDEVSLLDRDLIWFMPFQHDSALAQHYDNGREILLYLSSDATPEALVHSFFHEMGHHFADVFGDPLLQSPYGTWSEYSKLRKGTQWLPLGGWASRPQENIAEDFAYAFLPGDLSRHYQLRGSFPALSSNPDILKAFRDWAVKMMGQAAEPTVKFASAERILVSTGPIQGQYTAGKKMAYMATPELYESFQPQAVYVSRTKVGTDGNFSVPLATGSYDPIFMHMEFEQAPEQNASGMTIPRRVHTRQVAALPFPLSITATAPRSTKTADIALFTGKALGTMLINDKTDATVTLEPGDNQFTIKITPNIKGYTAPFTLTVPVYYEPAGTPTLSAAAPSAVDEPTINIMGRTQPRSLVRAGGAVTASDVQGRYSLTVKGLKSGTNTITVKAISPGGNEATKSLTVTYKP